jgi:hypothetical protein
MIRIRKSVYCVHIMHLTITNVMCADLACADEIQ